MERRIPCSRSGLMIHRIIHKEYFNCYKLYGRKPLGSRPSSGLSLLIYVDDPRDSEVGKDLALQKIGKGVILTLGERKAFLDPDSHGVEIIPNMVNVVRFRQQHRKRLPRPHGDCKIKYSIQQSLRHNFTLPYLYTRDTCYSACVEYYMIKTCGCHDVGQYGTLRSVFKNVPMCGATDEGRELLLKRMECVQKWRSFYRLPCMERCPSPCEEKKYTHHVSYLELLPAEVNKILATDRTSVPEEISHSSVQTDAQNFTADDIDMSNISWIHIKRHGDSYYLVEDIPKMTLSDWLAKIGGTCNLWSGITVFVLVELLDLFCRLCRMVFVPEIKHGQHGNTGNTSNAFIEGKTRQNRVPDGFL